MDQIGAKLCKNTILSFIILFCVSGQRRSYISKWIFPQSANRCQSTTIQKNRFYLIESLNHWICSLLLWCLNNKWRIMKNNFLFEIQSMYGEIGKVENRSSFHIFFLTLYLIPKSKVQLMTKRMVWDGSMFISDLQKIIAIKHHSFVTLNETHIYTHKYKFALDYSWFP